MKGVLSLGLAALVMGGQRVVNSESIEGYTIPSYSQTNYLQNTKPFSEESPSKRADLNFPNRYAEPERRRKIVPDYEGHLKNLGRNGNRNDCHDDRNQHKQRSLNYRNRKSTGMGYRAIA